MNKNNSMVEGSPTKLIIQFSIPVLISLLFQQIYTAADTAIVSKALGPQALAAVGCLNSVNFLILGFCNGMGSGFAIPIAQCFGAKDLESLKKYMGNMVWLFAFFAILVTIISVSLCHTILLITNTPSDIFAMAKIYMMTIFIGIPAQFAYNTLAGLLRSLGDSKNPLYILIGCSFLNIILDILFVIVIPWGVFGAAFATILSQFISSIGCLIIMYKNYEFCRLTKADLKIEKEYTGRLLKDGLPMAFQMSICGIGSLILQSSINSLGSVYVASVTAAERISQILQSVTASIGTTLTVFCGQNIGANQIKRVKQGVKTGVSMALIFSVIAAIFMYLFGKYVIVLFIDASEVELIQYTYQFLVINTCFFWGAGLIHTVRFSIQGMGYPSVSLIASTLEMIARTVIGLFVVPAFGFMGACFSNALAWIAADLFLVPTYYILVKKLSTKKEED